jgi:uncharacterized membrane protein
MPIALALPVSLATALLGWAGKGLSRDGAAAATVIGTVVLTLTGWAGALVLGAFFVPSTLIGRLTGGPPEIRTAAQVVANGAPAMAGSLLELRVPGLGLWIVTSSLAAAAADTWATALGRLSRNHPVLLGTRRRVPPGTSGAVSLLGSLGATGGALLVAGAGAGALRDTGWLGPALAIGIGGMFLDSGLGRWGQARFRCSVCGAATEHRGPHCGSPAILEQGWGWLDNNAVNLLTTLAAALAGTIIWVGF